MSDHDTARAKAPLDSCGYIDRGGGGWRDRPDGSPLLTQFSARPPDPSSRQQQAQWRRAPQAVNVKKEFRVAKWPEQRRASRAGKLMTWNAAWCGTFPDGVDYLNLPRGQTLGYKRHPFVRDWWRCVDLDGKAARP
jgi:hypothetical protein